MWFARSGLTFEVMNKTGTNLINIHNTQLTNRDSIFSIVG